MTTLEERPFAFGDCFWKSVDRLSVEDSGRVIKAVSKFQADQQHPGLQFKKLEADRSGRLYSFRAAQDIRVLVAREGATYVFLEAAPRQSVYDKIGKKRFTVNASTGFVGVIGYDDELGSESVDRPNVSAVRLTAGLAGDEERGVLDHWADADLLEAGFTIEAVGLLRLAKSEEMLCDLATERRISPADFDRAVDLFEMTPEQWRAPALIVDGDAAEQRFRRIISEFGALHGLSQFYSADELAAIAAAPIEDWMIFLHPDQRAVVRRRYDGPARVRGSAGTGKTVVALHRTAEIASRFQREEENEDPILFTTFIKTLPPVFESLYWRLPNAPAGARVEFINVDKLARRIVTDAGIKVNTNPNEINAAFAAAMRRVVVDGTPLKKEALTQQYLQDEITKVLKGRGITTVEEYLMLERSGRRVPFTAAMRMQLWELRTVWDELMRAKGTVDFPDVVATAAEIVAAGSGPRYRAAVIDEAQDLSLVGLRLVRGLTQATPGEDRSDGLLLVGDGGQRIYAGGFTLRQAGLQVTGRSTVLRANYRNTAAIIDAALAVAGDDTVEDLDDSEVYRRGEATHDATRGAGSRPMLIECAGPEDEAAWVARRIRALVDAGDVRYGDIGVFVPFRADVRRWTGVLESVEVPAGDLEKREGTFVDAVSIGTYHRAKGLEFKVVFLPGLDDRFPRPQDPGQDQHEYDEQRSLNLSQLYVAMTRARDMLYVSSPGPLSGVIDAAGHAFERLES